MKPTKTIPTFNNENEEREFWENHDATEYFDTSKVKMVRFPNLKKTTKSISIRLPVDMLDELKVKANSMDVPYQSFIKMLLQEGLSARNT
ncbi:MAG: BrnA antitoxin family protein [Epsilonproteobacteria bacterium]|nr:BrnA antitoxin family protein [Campylobacterota bacterium]